MDYAIQQGQLTTSDHIPIVFTLATSPIMIPQTEMFNFKRADWELFKDDIEQSINQPTREEKPVGKEYIDFITDNWYVILKMQ